MNQSVFLSADNGATWPKSVSVSPESGYSTVVVMLRHNKSTIVDLFDRANTHCDIKVALVDPLLV